MTQTKLLIVASLILAALLIGINTITLIQGDNTDIEIAQLEVKTTTQSIQAQSANTNLLTDPVETVSQYIESEKQKRISQAQRKERQARFSSQIEEQIQEEGESRVVITLDNPDDYQSILDSLGDKATLIKKTRRGLVVQATDSAITELESNSNVFQVRQDIQLEVAWDVESENLTQYTQAVNWAALHNLDITGSNQAVCVVDTGLESSHEAFDEATYLNGQGKVLYGYDYYDNNANWDDDNGHGTFIAGLIAGNSSTYKGILPDAKIIPMKVTNDAGTTWGSTVDEAIQDCVDNRTQYNITTIVVALRQIASWDFTPNDCIGADVNDALQNAVAAGMNVVAPSGNDGRNNTVAFPAVCENVTSVGGVIDANDQFWGSTNRHPTDLEVLAPATTIYGPGLSDSYANGAGTSPSAAMVAGAFMLLEEVGNQYYGANPTYFEMRNILFQTGVPVNDTAATQVEYPRLDFLAAVNYEEINPVVTQITANNAWSDTTVELQYTTNDTHHDISECRVYVNGALNGTNGAITEGQTTTHQVTLADGAHTWYVECDDTASIPNTETSSTRTINVDNAAPSVTQDSPADTHTETSTYDIDFQYTVTDTNDITSCELYVDGGLADTMNSPTKGSTQTFTTQTLSNGLHNWNVKCTDQYGNVDQTNNRTLTIAVPTSPTLTGIPDQNTDEDTAPPSQWVDLHAYAADPDNTTTQLTFTITDETNASLIDCYISSNRYLECAQPAQDLNGSSDVTIEVSDGADTDTDTLTVFVDAVNDAPTIAPVPNQDLLENSGENQDIVDFTAYVNDVDGPAGQVSCQVVAQSNTGVVDCSVDGSDRLDCTVVGNQTGMSNLTVTITDSIESINTTLIINVNNVNDAPTLSGVPDQDTNEDTTPPSQWVDLHSYSTDPDNTTAQLSYTITTETNSALIDCSIQSNRYFECNTPASNQFGSSDVTIEVSDGALTDTDTLTVTVNSVNDAPTLSGVPNQNLAYNSGENQDLEDLESFAGDVETAVGSLTYTIITETNTAVVDCSIDGSNRLDCTAQSGQSGSSDVTVEVSDGEDTDTDTFTVTVSGPGNTAPTLTGVPNVNTNEDTTPPSQWIDLWTYANDTENATPTLTFTITTETNSALIDCSISSNRYIDCNTPTSNQFGTSDVTVQVSDGQLADTDTFTVTVNSVNDVPTLSGLPNQNLNFNGGLYDDLFSVETYAGDVETPVGSLTYTITSETNTGVVDCSIDGSNNIDCDVQPGQSGTNTVTVEVDDGSDTAQDSFDVTVSPPANQPPSFTNMPNVVNGDEGAEISFDVDASDPESDPVTFSILAGSEPGMTIDQNTGVFNWTPTFSQSGSYNVTIMVEDGTPGNNDTDTLTINVADVQPSDLYVDTLISQMGAGTQNQVFTYTVRNSGSSTVNSFEYRFTDGLGGIHTGTISTNLGPGGVYFGLQQVTYATTGSGSAELYVDQNNLITELDENNNNMSIQVTVN